MRMPLVKCLCCLFWLGTVSPATLWAQKPDAKPGPAAKADASAADLLAIRQGSQAFVEAFDKADAKAIAALWTEDGDYVNEAGQRFAGREAIEQQYQAFFAEHPQTEIQLVIDSLRMLSPTAAIEDGRAILNPAPSGAPAASKYTAVHVKIDGVWLVSTIRDDRIESPSGFRNIADFEWLIGTWTAEAPAGKMESVCRWVANKSFVQRTYTTTLTDGTTTTGVQLIGFNPIVGQIQSWNFSSDGGLAIGVWTPIEDGWAAELTGAMGDGTPTRAVNLLTRLDDKAYTWQSLQRSVGDASLPNTGEVILKRSAAK